ncbi:hypothetical protein EYF80_024084 [Liparis tanakae]|uniref:Uncharacterized protein n=1 Tax=Liparis tanakae TaxID=230148 RepID=A0A4Z2HJD0_9TELE|nr:hypothetical protein EYF80_024084 [Liparis tanakae]
MKGQPTEEQQGNITAATSKAEDGKRQDLPLIDKQLCCKVLGRITAKGKLRSEPCGQAHAYRAESGDNTKGTLSSSQLDSGSSSRVSIKHGAVLGGITDAPLISGAISPHWINDLESVLCPTASRWAPLFFSASLPSPLGSVRRSAKAETQRSGAVGAAAADALAHSRRIHPKRLAVPPRSSASPRDLPDPRVPVPSAGSEKPKRTQGTTAGRRESGRLRSRSKDQRDKDSPLSLAAVVNQANHSTPEFRPHDPEVSCGIKPPSPDAASTRGTAPANNCAPLAEERDFLLEASEQRVKPEPAYRKGLAFCSLSFAECELRQHRLVSLKVLLLCLLEADLERHSVPEGERNNNSTMLQHLLSVELLLFLMLQHIVSDQPGGVLGPMSFFQGSSGCWLVLLIAEGRHQSGQGPPYG